MIIVRIIVFGLMLALLSCKSTTVIQESYSSKETIYFEDYILRSVMNNLGYRTTYEINEDSVLTTFKDYLSALNLNVQYSERHENKVTEEIVVTVNSNKLHECVTNTVVNIAPEDSLLHLIPYIGVSNKAGIQEGGRTFYSVLTIGVFMVRNQ